MTKDDLRQYLAHQRAIDRLGKRIESINNQLYSYKSVVVDDMPKCTAANDTRDYLIDLKQCLINEYIQRQYEHHREMVKIEHAILQLRDERYKTLLSLRYLDACTWDYIADHMGYDLRWIYRLHGQALKAISHCKPL